MATEILRPVAVSNSLALSDGAFNKGEITAVPSRSDIFEYHYNINEVSPDDDATYLSFATSALPSNAILFSSENILNNYENISRVVFAIRFKIDSDISDLFVYAGYRYCSLYNSPAAYACSVEDSTGISIQLPAASVWENASVTYDGETIIPLIRQSLENAPNEPMLVFNLASKIPTSAKSTGVQLHVTQAYAEVTYNDGSAETINTIRLKENGSWAEIPCTIYTKQGGTWIESNDTALRSGAKYKLQNI